MICVRWLPGGDYPSRPPPALLPPAPAALCVIARGGSAGDGPITMRAMLQGEGQGEAAREGLTPKGAEPGKDAQPSRVSRRGGRRVQAVASARTSTLTNLERWLFLCVTPRSAARLAERPHSRFQEGFYI